LPQPALGRNTLAGAHAGTPAGLTCGRISKITVNSIGWSYDPWRPLETW
jgi:hypothetical protein